MIYRQPGCKCPTFTVPDRDPGCPVHPWPSTTEGGEGQ